MAFSHDDMAFLSREYPFQVDYYHIRVSDCFIIPVHFMISCVSKAYGTLFSIFLSFRGMVRGSQYHIIEFLDIGRKGYR